MPKKLAPAGIVPLAKNSMRGSQLKKIGQSLGRFALKRENAPFPQDRLIVQATAGELKVIGLAPYGTLACSVAQVPDKLRAIIAARPFLEFTDSLKAKDIVTFIPAVHDWHYGLEVSVNDGPVTFFERITTDMPADIILPPKDVATGYFDLKDSTAIATAVDGLSNGIYGRKAVQIMGNILTGNDRKVNLIASDRYKWGSIMLDGTFGLWGTVEAEFLYGLRDLGEVRVSIHPQDKVVEARRDGIAAYGMFDFLGYAIPTELKGMPDITNQYVVDRLELVRNIRNVLKLDTLARIMLQYNKGSIKVEPFDDGDGLKVSGKLLLDILTNVKAEKVGIGIRGKDLPITVKDNQWQIHVAPLTLKQNEKSVVDPKTLLPGIYGD